MHSKSTSSVTRLMARIDYEIPERYRNSFYLANAAFFDSTNWFLHRTYEMIFPSLKNTYRNICDDPSASDIKIHENLENAVESLDQCNSIIDVRFPIRRDNGRLEVVRGFRAHYGEAVQNAPCLGGLRIHEDITRDQMKALSLLSSMKNSCLGAGLAGAMGGIKINPKNYSENELKAIIDLYVTELFQKGYCNRTDIAHPDINTADREMGWVGESLAKCSGQKIGVASTGKPSDYGGVEGYYEAAALGAFKSLETFINNKEVMLKTGCVTTGFQNKRFIIQGLGKVGKPLGLMVAENGAICVGVKEKEAYLYDPKGIDLKALCKYRDEHGTIENFGLSKTEYPDSIFTEECDILILAAHQKSLVCYVARDVKSKIILEAADGPVTPTAHQILVTKSKLVIPDIYACAGTNVISYFEYLKNLRQIGLPEGNLLRFSTEIYASVFRNMYQDRRGVEESSYTENNVNPSAMGCDFTKACIECIYAEIGQEILKNLESHRFGVDVRTAAYAVAIKNMFKAVFKRKTLI